jgi:hypothetical protein
MQIFEQQATFLNWWKEKALDVQYCLPMGLGPEIRRTYQRSQSSSHVLGDIGQLRIGKYLEPRVY